MQEISGQYGRERVPWYPAGRARLGAAENGANGIWSNDAVEALGRAWDVWPSNDAARGARVGCRAASSVARHACASPVQSSPVPCRPGTQLALNSPRALALPPSSQPSSPPTLASPHPARTQPQTQPPNNIQLPASQQPPVFFIPPLHPPSPSLPDHPRRRPPRLPSARTRDPTPTSSLSNAQTNGSLLSRAPRPRYIATKTSNDLPLLYCSSPRPQLYSLPGRRPVYDLDTYNLSCAHAGSLATHVPAPRSTFWYYPSIPGQCLAYDLAPAAGRPIYPISTAERDIDLAACYLFDTP